MFIGIVRIIFGCLLVTQSAHAQTGAAPFAANQYAQSRSELRYQPLHEPLYEPRFETVGAGAIPRSVVASVAQDKAGFLWIATGDGLVRYDGYRFRPLEFASAKPAERNLGWVRALLPARDGRLWIGSEANGLAVYDPHSDTLNFPRKDPAAGAAVHTIFALAEDLDNSIWVGTVGAGLARYDPLKARYTYYRHSQQTGSLPDDRIQALLVDRQGTLWVGSWRGLSRRVRGSENFETVRLNQEGSTAESTVQALFESSDGRIWVGTRQGGLAIVNPAKSANALLERAVEQTTNQQGSVSSFLEAPGGQIWVGHSLGIDLHALGSGKLLRQLRHNAAKSFSLAANEVSSLLLDRAGSIWVGGFGLGLQRHDPNNRSIWVRGADQLSASPLGNPDVRSLLQLSNGEILAASHSGSVALLDRDLRSSGSMRPQIQSKHNASGTRNDTLQTSAMAQTSDGSIWLAAESVLVQFNRARQQSRAVPHQAGMIRRLFAASDGTLWVATQDGLYLLEPGAGALTRVLLKNGQALTGEIHSIAEGPDHSLWVGGVQGLFNLPKGERELKPVLSKTTDGLGNPIVIGLLFDHQQRLWIDTAVAGLHRMTSWDGQFASFDRVSARHGIVHRPFGANLLEDARGRIWTHMYVYDPALDRLDELTASDGVDFGTGWFFSYTKLHDGRFLFGGSKGILVVKPELYDASSYAPPLVVSELRINGQPQLAGPLQAGLRISPGQRSFSMEFAALDYSAPARNHYAYRLQGFDPDWINTGADFRVASYSNLNPGNYVLKVRATNRSGLWSPREMAINVKVLPAWWQSWWFQLTMGALMLAAAHAVLQLRRRKLLWRRQALERTAELEQLTQVLEQESAALKESSLTDPLTGLRNRRFLTQQIYADVALAWRRYENVAQHPESLPQDADLIFFLIDIDNFKQVNDRYGHGAGDAVILQIAERLRLVFRETDYLVRWGGEEFLVVARATERKHGAKLAERVRAIVADQVFELGDGLQLSMSCSLGFSCFPLAPSAARALDWDAAVKSADAALYVVKRSGKNGWLGLLQTRTESSAALRAWLQQPLLEWMRSGELETAASFAYPPVDVTNVGAHA